MRLQIKAKVHAAGPWVNHFTISQAKKLLREFRNAKILGAVALKRILQAPVRDEDLAAKKFKIEINRIWKEVALELDFASLTLSKSGLGEETKRLADLVMSELCKQLL